MIKRQYFISAEIVIDNKVVSKSWRLMTWRSFFPQKLKVLNTIQEEIAKTHYISIDKLHITAFNRC